MMNRRVLALFLFVALLLTGCGKRPADAPSPGEELVQETPAELPAEPEETIGVEDLLADIYGAGDGRQFFESGLCRRRISGLVPSAGPGVRRRGSAMGGGKRAGGKRVGAGTVVERGADTGGFPDAERKYGNGLLI